MKKKFMKVLKFLGYLLLASTIVGSIYVKISFPKVYFEEIIFYLTSGVEDSDSRVFTDAILFCLPFVLLALGVLYALLYDITFGKVKKKYYPIKAIHKHRKLTVAIVSSISVIALLWCVGLFNFIIYANSSSNFIEEQYVNPKDVKITFNEKRNLIFIVVESLETTFFTKEHGGYWDKDVTSGLYKLLNDKDAITFYNKNKAQGMKMITGASWTTGSIVTNTTGVPFKIRINKNEYHSKDFMNGSYALGDLLKDNGYYNEVISSAKTSFGGIKEYYTKHGDYEIIDLRSLDKYGLTMKNSDRGKWGLNDNYIFEAAKKRLDIISKQDQPFNLELITIDTHFRDGFIGDYSVDKYDTQYENVYATESKLIYNFIEWLKKQDYYENTTVVIVGDHLSMQNNFFTMRGIKMKDRYVYNCIINPAVKTTNNKNRIITALDSYPTIVTAIGGNVEGDQLGLGVNLFSNKKTMAEKYGVEYLDDELQKKSTFYNNVILNDKYIDKYRLD